MAENQVIQEKGFLGVGWRYPVGTDRDGAVSLSQGEQDIREAIWIILATAHGERVMRPDFGCGIHELVFAPMTPSTFALVKKTVNDALVRWEPRIEVENVEVGPDSETDNRLLISIDYKIRANNTRNNLVYPFYLQEGR